MNTTLKEIPRRKPRRSRAQIDAMVAQYRESGLNCRAFARQVGIEVGSLYSWLRVRTQTTKLAGFAAVEVTGSTAPGLVSAGMVTLKSVEGWHLEIAGGLGPEFCAKLLRELMPCLR